ncbi:hypothetical protein HN51_047968 [Arachis hypogaea]|nr:Mannosylglycoprotein endo-beta-mannosidase [Arachis hypogaea]QHO24411.1 Mannosylglycoprotein endo-beta-mannosidase [Arachis hypogaea]
MECVHTTKFMKAFTMLPKTVTPIFEMDYPKSEHAKPVYFLLLKLYDKSNNRVLSRNLYWLHLPGGDYKLLEPYRKKKIPLKITSEIFVKGSTYRFKMHVENISKGPNIETVQQNMNWVGLRDYTDALVVKITVVKVLHKN